jgi:hypothetical protein
VIRALWTVIAVHAAGKVTHLGCHATSWKAAEDIAQSWRATYRCPVHVVRAS